MCLAVPMKIIKIKDNTAIVSLGGTEREIRLDAIDRMPELGDYVIVHAGFAIHKIDEKEAEETLKLLELVFAGDGSQS